MSSDYAFWKRASEDPGVVFDVLSGIDVGHLIHHPDVLAFREQLIDRWPDLRNTLEPDDEDVEAQPELAEHYVLLTLSYRQLDYLDDILAMAEDLGLVGFSGVDDAPIGQVKSAFPSDGPT